MADRRIDAGTSRRFAVRPDIDSPASRKERRKQKKKTEEWWLLLFLFVGAVAFVWAGVLVAISSTLIRLAIPSQQLPVALDDHAIVQAAQYRITPLLNDQWEGTGRPVIEVIVRPSHGVAAVDGDTLLYTVTARYTGPDELQYVIRHGRLVSEPATVGIEVRRPPPVRGSPPVAGDGHVGPDKPPMNRRPIADAGASRTITTAGDQASVVLDGRASRDPDGDLLRFFWTAPALRYQSDGPNPSISLPLGTTAIALVVSDDKLRSAPAEIHITVQQAPRSFLAVDDILTISEDDRVVLVDALLTNDSWPGEEKPKIRIHRKPKHGGVNPLGRKAYRPHSDFSGTDAFQYALRLGTEESNSATVTITVTPVNDPPQARIIYHVTGQRVNLIGTSSSDAENSPLTYRWIIRRIDFQSTDATATVDLPLGATEVTLEVSDGQLLSTTSEVVTINPSEAKVAPTVNFTISTTGCAVLFNWQVVSAPEGARVVISREGITVTEASAMETPGKFEEGIGEGSFERTYRLQLIDRDGQVLRTEQTSVEGGCIK